MPGSFWRIWIRCRTFSSIKIYFLICGMGGINSFYALTIETRECIIYNE